MKKIAGLIIAMLLAASIGWAEPNVSPPSASSAITQTITAADTTHAPSGDAAFNALATKLPLAGGNMTGAPNAPAYYVTSPTQSFIQFSDSTGAANKGFRVGRSLNGADGNDFFIYDFTAGTTRMYFDGTGAANIPGSLTIGSLVTSGPISAANATISSAASNSLLLTNSTKLVTTVTGGTEGQVLTAHGAGNLPDFQNDRVPASGTTSGVMLKGDGTNGYSLTTQFIDANGNILYGNGAAAGTSAVKTHVVAEGTGPTTSPANASQYWSADYNSAPGTNRLHERTESGVVSPIALQTEVDASMNPKAMSQSVALTAAASGSSGITVPYSSVYANTTNNFTLYYEAGLPNWIFGQDLITKRIAASSTWYTLRLSSSGYLQQTLRGATLNEIFTSTIPVAITAGIVGGIASVVVRETPSIDGSVTFYVNGSQLGSSIVISKTMSGAGESIANTNAFYISGDDTIRNASTTQSAAIYNRALTAAEVKDLYNNGINAADKWGSQTSKITGNDSTFAGASNWANVDINAYDETTGGVLTITANAAGQYCTLPIANATTIVGKKYRLTYTVASIAATWTVTDFTGTGQTIGTVSADGTNSIEFTAATTGGLRLVSVANNSSGVFDNFLLYEVGATLALEPSGIKTAKWYDSSSNALDAAYPAVGSSLTIPYQLGTESLLSITNVSLAADADTTIYTVPTGRRVILTKALLIAGADAGATSAISIGADGTETDFIPAAVLSNLDAANDVVVLQPVPVAALPVKNKSYAAGTIIQAQVGTQSGGATNTLKLFGILY